MSSTESHPGLPYKSLAIQLGVSVPNHELLKQIGRGSYGEVWLARSQVGRFRAVKVVYKGLFSTSRPFEREFEGIKNFEPISRLHPGFLNILHVGMSDEGDYFFCVMELADDAKLGTQIDPATYVPRTLADAQGNGGQVPVEEAIKLGVQLARSLDFLHGRGLIHRDIKPSNIIFVGSATKLADIGLVAEIGRDLSFVGTSGYLPPEGAVSPRSDIFSLGRVLYELATGQDRKSFPVFPTDGQPITPLFLELNEVLLKACQVDPLQRYASAAELAQDLELIATGHSLRQQHLMDSRLARFKRTSLVIAVAAVGLFGVSWQINSKRQHEIEINRQKIGDRIARATSHVNNGEFLSALPVLTEAWQLDSHSSENETVHRIRFAATLASSPVLSGLERRHESEIFGLSDGGDGTLFFANTKDNVYKRTESGPLQPLWNKTDPSLRHAYFSKDGRVVATIHEQAPSTWSIHVRDLRNQTLLARYEPESKPTSACFNAEATLLVTGQEDGQILIRNLATGNIERRIRSHSDAVLWVEISPDQSLLSSASKDSTAKLWDLAESETRRQTPALKHDSWVYAAVFHPHKPILVTSSYDRTCKVWNTSTGDEMAPPMRSDNGIQSLDFSPDGEVLVGAGISWKIHLWDGNTFRPLTANPTIPLHSRPESVRFVQDGERIAAGCTDGSLHAYPVHCQTA